MILFESFFLFFQIVKKNRTLAKKLFIFQAVQKIIIFCIIKKNYSKLQNYIKVFFRRFLFKKKNPRNIYLNLTKSKALSLYKFR